MSHEKTQKILVRRKRRTETDDRGRNVWAGPVESAELELVSTTELQLILKSNDAESRQAISRAAASTADGVLARDASNGTFEIIDDAELQAILDANDDEAPAVRPAAAAPEPVSPTEQADELSLVNTQMLRKLLGEEEATESSEDADVGGGFDPYDNG